MPLVIPGLMPRVCEMIGSIPQGSALIVEFFFIIDLNAVNFYGSKHEAQADVLCLQLLGLSVRYYIINVMIFELKLNH